VRADKKGTEREKTKQTSSDGEATNRSALKGAQGLIGLRGSGRR
jgi:hypothetical protein